MTIASLVVDIGANTTRIVSGGNVAVSVMDKVERSAGAMSMTLATSESHANSFGGSLRRIAEDALGFFSAQTALRGIEAAFGFVAKAAIGMNATLETTTLQFTTLMGDAQKAQTHVQALFDIAKKTPFETGPIIQASLKLQTFGGDALNTRDNIMLLGDAAAATGAPIDELGFWVGRLYSNLKGGQPFGEAAMRLQELAVMSPQARQQMEALQASGKSGAEVFQVFKDSLGGFTGAMEAQAGTWQGVVSTFTDTINILMADTFKPYFEVIRDLGAQVNKALDGMSASMGDVKAQVADTKSAFIGLVDNGLSATLKAIAFVMVEFNAAKVVFGDVLQVVDGFALAFEYASLGVAKLVNVATFGKVFGEDVKRINENIDSLLATISKRGAALQADKAAQTDWVQWSDRAVGTVHGMTSALSTATPAVSAHAASMSHAASAATVMSDAQKKASKAVAEFNANVNAVLLSAQGYGAVLDTVDGSVLQAVGYYRAQGVEMGRLAKMYDLSQVQVEALAASEKEETDALQRQAGAMGSVAAQMEKRLKLIQAGAGQVLDEPRPLQVFDPRQLAGLNKVKIPNLFENFAADAKAFFSKGTFGQTIVGALMGGGGLKGGLQAAGSQLGGMFTSNLATAAEKSIGGTVGNIVGSFIGPLGSLLGPAMGKVGAWIGNTFFHSQEKAVNKTRQAYIDAAGGLTALNVEARNAGVTLDRLLDAKKPEAYTQAVNDLNAALKFQDDAMQTLDETVKRYGFTIDELGPAFARQQLDKQAGALFQDFKVLTAAGLDVDTVLGRMGSSINDFVRDALKTGSEVPAAMAPMLQRMVELGQLTDANGDVITDLDKAGVHFSMTMSEGFAKVVESVQKLTDAIARGLGLTLDRLPSAAEAAANGVNAALDSIETDRSIDIRANILDTGRFDGADIIPMAQGGMGRVTGPTLFLAGEAGAEDVAFSGGGKSFGSGQQPGGNVVNLAEVRSELAELRQAQAAHNDYMRSQFSRDIARATRDEVQKVAWRRSRV